MRYFTVIFSLLLFFIAGELFAQAPSFDWAVQAGYYSSSDYSDNVAVDNSGNIVVTGSVDSTIDFGGDYILNSFGANDMFIAKYDSNGNIIWAKHAGSKNYDCGNAVAVDKNGNIYVTGIYSDSADFDSNILYTGGGQDAFLAKYSAGGQLLWVRNGGGEYDDYSNGVTTDKLGNVIITGGYVYDANFNSVYLNGPGTYNIFIIKYDSQGNILWAKNGGGEGYNNIGESVVTDSQNDVIITGSISDTATFGSSNIIPIGSTDIMIAKYDASGNLIWIRQAGGAAYDDYGTDISTDKNDNIYITGDFSGSASFGGIQVSSSNSSDIFTAKYDVNGNPLWVKKDSYDIYNYGGSICSDPAGNITVTGTAYPPGYIPPPRDTVNKQYRNIKEARKIYTKASKPDQVTSLDQYLYIVKYNKDGIKMWDKSVYSAADGGISNAPNGDLVLTGNIFDQVYFDSLSLTSAGFPDIFVAKIPSPKISVPSMAVPFGFKSLSDTTHYIAIGDTASKYIEIKNTSKAFLHFFNTSVIAPKNDFTLDPLSLVDSIPPYQSAYLHINYIAKDISSNAVLQISSDASTSPDTINLKGYGAPVPLVYQSDSLNFGTTDVKDTLGKTLKVTNNGSVAVKLLGENLNNQTDFISGIFSGTIPDSIKPYSSNDYIIKFNPQSTGIKTGRLIINSNSSHGQDTIYLSGTGILRTLAFSSKQINYGNIDVGDSLTNAINITNSGTVDIVFLNKNLTNKTDYYLSDISVPDTIKPGKSKVYNIKFKPLSSGIKPGKLILSSNSKSSPDTVNLTGNGIVRAIIFSSKQINFNNFDVKDTLEITLKIINSGNAVVKLLSENLTNPTDFISGIFDGTVPDSILPGASNDYKIKFNPQSAGIKTGKLILLSNSKTSPDTINLNGTGILRTLAFSSSQLNYGNVDVGDSLGKEITITNNGTIDIILLNKNLTNQTEFKLSEISVPDTIHPGGYKVYDIKFSPLSSGIKTGKLILSSNSKSSPDTVNLTGVGIVRAITFSSKQINYGNVDVGGWLDKSITITNSGTVDIIFSNKNLTEQSDFTLMDSSVTDSIHSLKSKDYTIKFYPKSPGIKTCKLIFTSNSKTSPDTVNLTGTGIQRALTFSTREINFGNVDVGSSLAKAVTVTNNGTINIIFSNKNLTGQTDFNLSGISAPDTILPGKSKDYNFEFSPKSSGLKTGKLIFTSNSQSSPDTVNLLGTGILRTLTFSSKQIDFGNVDVNGWLEKSISLTNGSTVDILISNKNFTNSNDFTLMNSPVPDTIYSLKSKDLMIKFNPMSPGIKTSKLIITSNSKTSPDTVNLTGTGIQRALTFSTREINFGNVDVGSSLKETIAVTNNGTVDIIFSNKSLIDQNDFSLLEITVPDTIHAGKSKNYNFEFKPKSAGYKTGKLIFTGNSESSPDTVNLIGNGIIRNLVYSSRYINYGNVDVGGELEKTLTITNSGTVDIIFSSIFLSDQINYSLTNVLTTDTIHVNNSKDYTVRFNPKTAEIKTASLIFTSNSTSSRDTVLLTGTGIFRTLTFSTRQLDYGNVDVGNSLQKSINITNNGTVNIIFSNKSLTNPTDFSLLDFSVPDTLHPGISKGYRIKFNPKSPGNKTGKIIFSSNSEGGSDTLILTGNGTSAVMNLSSNFIDFGTINIDSNSVYALKISNTGSGSLIINNYLVTGSNPDDFRISNNILPDSILPHNSRDIIVKFNPQTSGNKNALLLILSNSTLSSDTVKLTGKGASLISVELANNTVGQNTELTINPPQGFNFNNNKLYYRKGGERTYQNTDLILTNDSYIGVIPASYSTITGIQYYVIFSEEGYSVTYPANNPVNYPAYIEVSVPKFTYPTAIRSSVYQMISIPLHISNPQIDSVLGSSFGVYDNTKWRILRWNPASDSYSEYPSLNGDLIPGNAFWLIENESKSFNINNAVTVSSSEKYGLKLQPGWNQIGDPYAYPVDWDSVMNTGGVQLPVHWNPDIEDYEINQSILQPWDGYWVFNPDTGFITITFRPIGSNGVPKNKAAKSDLKSDEFLIQLKANIEKTNIIDEENYAGMLEDAKDGKDKHDVLAPPSVTGNLNFNIVSGDTEFAENIVSSSKDGAYWDIRLISSQKDKNLIVELDKTTLPEGFQIWYLDKDRLLSIPINRDKISIPVPSSGKGSYRLIVGNEEYAKKHSENIPLVPLEYSLSQNYPNPFNPSTKINYQLKEQSKVTLEIYNILGQKIKVLVDNEVANPGQYRVTWDGTNQTGSRVATGVYIYRIIANSFISSKKMLLLK